MVEEARFDNARFARHALAGRAGGREAGADGEAHFRAGAMPVSMPALTNRDDAWRVHGYLRQR
jgi:hypothetical protein